MPESAPKKPLWFVLGREKELSLAEISAVTGNKTVTRYSRDIGVTKTDQSGTMLMQRLGGTVKIGTELAQTLNKNGLIEAIVENLKKGDGKIHFGLSWYGEERPGVAQELTNWGKEIKRELLAEGRSVRYVLKNEPALSSVTVAANHLVEKGGEFLIITDPTNSQLYCLAKTTAIQPFQEFSNRDFGRPGRDDESGMLPPKLAKMMLNLLGAELHQTVFDPFCGSGTILSEALLMGYTNVIGSDISAKAIEDTTKNIIWLKERFSHIADPLVFQADATKPNHLALEPVDGIATEPFLGKPLTGREKELDIIKQRSELKDLYFAALSAWKKILKPGASVLMVFPRFQSRGHWLDFDWQAIIQNSGYKIIPLSERTPYLLYARPTQHVGRELWKFSKNT